MLACRMAEERHYGCLTNFLNGTPESSLPQCAPFRVGVREINHSLSLCSVLLRFSLHARSLIRAYSVSPSPSSQTHFSRCVRCTVPRTLCLGSHAAFVARIRCAARLKHQRPKNPNQHRPPAPHTNTHTATLYTRYSGGVVAAAETCKGHDATVKW